jgi:hypothetical protein
MDTDRLIERLSHAPPPVRPLPRPLLRTLGWLVLSLPYLALVVHVMTARADLTAALTSPRFVVEQVAALATAAAAAYAAFCASIPGRDRRLLTLPLLPLAIWLGSVGGDCLVALARSDVSSLRFEEDWMCLPAIALAGSVPAALIVVMLRRGAPLAPMLTMGLGGLAAAGLGGFGLRLFHAEDASLMVLVWQLGTVALLSILSGLIGPQVLNWRRYVQMGPPRNSKTT